MSQKNEKKKNVAKELLTQGYTISKTAEMIGVSISTVSSWKLPRHHPWHDEALKMHYNWVSGRKIAQKLGVSRSKVARFLKDKPRGPNPYAPEDQKHVAGQEIT